MLEKLTPEAVKVMELARNEARNGKRAFLGTEQVLVALIDQNGPVGQALVRRGAKPERVKAEIVRIIGEEGPGTPAEIPLTGRLKTSMNLALDESRKAARDQVGPEHLLLGILREPQGVLYSVLLNMEIDPNDLRNDILAMVAKD